MRQEVDTGGEKSSEAAVVFAPPARRLLVDDVVDRLRDAILGGVYAPDQPLREDELASALKVSNGPIREALAHLEREGLVVRRRHRGAIVARLSREDVEEVFSMRLALERLAIQFAVRRASDGEFDAMEAVLGKMAEAVNRGMPNQEAAELDMEFHSLLYRAAHHRRLLESWLLLKPAVHIFLLSRKVTDPSVRHITVATHRIELEALRSRDEERAAAVFGEHLWASYQGVLQSYQ
jgi:DNA-binding GntR family transcriptional regulator